jgi:hypothetical protein
MESRRDDKRDPPESTRKLRAKKLASQFYKKE